MVISLKGLCLELDSIIVTYFDAFDQTIKLQNELNKLMKDGFLYMAKARANMGVQSVSTLQYPEEMSASLKVNNITQAETEDYLDAIKFEIMGNENFDESKDTDGLRQRKKDNDEKDLSSAVEDLDIKEKKPKDPIRWFGVLVPQPLRDSQSQFKRAAEISVSLATKKAEMEMLRKKYLELQVVKNDIINSE